MSRVSPRRSTSKRTGARVMFMMSSGGLTAAELFAGKDAILSGPAGGVVAMAQTGTSAGFDRVIGFDMGGTSTDVAHFDGQYERAFETEVAGVRMRAPMMMIHTVAAGGGSILHYDGARFRVGPDSAGADPGPSATAAAGRSTVTDANLMTGKLIPDFFPKIFGPAPERAARSTKRARKGFGELAREVGDGRSAEEVADGFIAIAVAKMAEAIKKISVARGYDVTRYALELLRRRRRPARLRRRRRARDQDDPDPSALVAAFGLRHGPRRHSRASRAWRSRSRWTTTHWLARRRAASNSAKEVGDEAGGAGRRRQAHQHHRRASCCAIPAPTRRSRSIRVPTRRHAARVREGAQGAVRLHRSRPRRSSSRRIKVEAVGGGAKIKELVERHRRRPRRLCPKRDDALLFQRRLARRQGLSARETRRSAHGVDGPALIIEPHQTIVVEDGWRAEITAKNHVVMRRVAEPARREAIGAKADPVMLEIFNNLFMSIAEQMGVTLQNTAYSVNIKERLDFSCAVFDRHGRLVANAPHMPVHLGSMDRSVETIIRLNAGRIRAGDVFALNAPYNGGTHLPDITVCTPVFDETGKTILFWVASRGHHADIGGVAPGSMSPRATNILEEGVYIDNFKLVERGTFPRARTLRAARRRPISRAQSAAERQRPQGADRRQREGRARA